MAIQIHSYGYPNPILSQLLTIHVFYGYSQSTSTATHNTFLQLLLIIHFFHGYHQPFL